MLFTLENFHDSSIVEKRNHNEQICSAGETSMIKLQSVTIGILYKKAFRVLDGWGEIVDSILYDDFDTSFDNAYFPQVQSSGFEKALFNSTTKNSLRLTSDNLIFTHNIPEKKNCDSERKWAIDKFSSGPARKILEKYDLAIARLGVVYSMQLTKEEYERFKKKYFKETVKDISAFRFAINLPMAASVKEHDVNDYINKIYTVQINDDTYSVSYDYQMFFLPLRGCWIDSHYTDFFSNSWTSFQNDVISCIGDE